MNVCASSLQNDSWHLVGVEKHNVRIEIHTYSMLCFSLSRYISHFQVTFLRRNNTIMELNEIYSCK